jgi:3-phosphoshikimate 1-carboxyvinyltransferase
MSLPSVIEIHPLESPAPARLRVPGSKSITNRALIRAVLARGEVTLHGALWSEDTQSMVACLEALGLSPGVEPDPEEPGNRTIRLRGQGGALPAGGTESDPLSLYVANAGTTARGLAALLCLGSGCYRLHGTPRMHERPQQGLVRALRELGYRIDSENERLPLVVHGSGARPGSCEVDIEKSSQFASALLLCADHGGWEVRVVGESGDDSPYVKMTRELVSVFPSGGGEFAVEMDSSSGSYLQAARFLFPESDIEILDWPSSDWQVDSRFPSFLPQAQPLSRIHDLGDSIMTAIVLAPLGSQPARFDDLGRLRVQECERVVALRTELTKCGANVVETGDSLQVSPSALHGADIDTYEDHRMAMCFAILGLKVPGIRIRDPECVRKTFPGFYQKLAAPPPHGLGAQISDAATGRDLSLEELALG